MASDRIHVTHSGLEPALATRDALTLLDWKRWIFDRRIQPSNAR